MPATWYPLLARAFRAGVLAVFNLGLAHAALGNDEESIKYLKRTLELDPTNFTAAFDLGVAYLHKQMIPVRSQRSRNTHDRRPGA